ncbi:MAG: hypothetical protein ACRCVJ_06010 [Clostridium sp.]|uniref:hypothetical protein n=1 Tax=Clostridium sp. TaxID=1506 RepID=UPI003F2C7F3C
MKKAMLVALVGVIGASLLVGCGDSDKNKNDTSNNQTQVEQTKKDDKIVEYKSGIYEVGKDLPAGEYLVARDKIDKEVETSILVAKDSKKEDAIYDESIDGDVYVTVQNGQFLDVENGNIFEIDKAPTNTPKDKVYKDGMYKVPRDIKAGTYEVKAIKDDGTVEIYKDSKHTKDSLVSKKEFKKTEKITLKDGEYVTLDDAEITVK